MDRVRHRERVVHSLEHLVPFIDRQQRFLWSVASERLAPDGWGTSPRVAAWQEAVLGWAGWLLGRCA